MMRKLLLLLALFCVSIGTWAQAPSGATAIGNNGSYWIVQDGVITVHVEQAGDLIGWASNELGWSCSNVPWNSLSPKPTTLKFDPAPTVSMADMGNQNDFYILWESNPYAYDFIDFSSLTDAQATAIITANQLKFGDNAAKGIIVPSSYSTDPGSFISKPAINNYGINGTDVYANIKSNTNSNLAGVVAKVPGDVTSVNISGTATGSEVINAINNLTTAADVNITGKMHAGTSIAITNNVITDIDFSDLKPADGSTLDIDLSGCTNLENVNLSGANVNNVDLTGLANLQTVNLDGTKIGGEVDVTGSLNEGLQITVASTDVAKIVPTLDETQQAEFLDVVVVVPAPEGAWEDAEGCCWVYYDSTAKVATVHAKKPGHFATLFAAHQSAFAEGTKFVFDSSCKPNAADIMAITGAGQNNKYYADLFDVTDGGADAAITSAVAQMVSQHTSLRGIILPYNSTLGTSAVVKNNGSSNSTFTEYAAYYRESDDAKNLVLHVFDYSYYNGWGSVAATNYTAAVAHLNTHKSVIENAWTVLVSTNSEAKFDLTKLSAAKVEVEITTDDMVGGGYNTNVPDRADIYVNATAPGGFAEHISTAGTKNTPTNLLQISGNITASDLLAVNDFSAGGPRILDLSKATVQGAGITASTLSDIANSDIEYIILPPGLSKDVVCGANYSDLTNLKAVISSSNTELVAHVAQAGSLAKARTLATGGTSGTIPYPAKVGLTTVTLSGNLNAADIKANSNDWGAGSDGHWKAGGDEIATGLASEQTTITSLDLRDAVFETNADMNLSYAGLTSLTSLQLPISSQMTTLPAYSLYNIQTLPSLCIPSNFTRIEDYALGLNSAKTIITDTDDHKLYIGKNGDTFLTEAEALAESNDTYTFSKNVAFIGEGAFQTTTHSLSDIYVMATTTPVCEKDAFAEGMCVGWQGFTGGSYPYCREKYRNGDFLYTVLHFPSQGTMSDEAYEQMKKNYTDVTKVYTKKEQSGAVDANGQEIAWPTFSELRRVYAQASAGLTWHDWATAYDGQNEVNETASTDGKTVDTSITGETYDFDNYIGWHQFVLTMANYYEPTDKKENDKIVRDYEEAGLYTFCIPFNMTYEQVVEWLGVPKSTDKVINRLKGEQVDENIMPEIHQLLSVEREKGTGGKNNVVTFRLTKNLFNYNHEENSILTYYLDINNSGTTPQIRPLPAQVINAGQDDDAASNPITLLAGRPYVIKAYKRVNVVNGVDEFKITGQNIAKMIMTRYADQFELKQSAVENGLYEQLGNDPDATTLRFAIPYEGHKIQAMKAGGNSAYLEYTEDGKKHKYYYTMVGQYWEQPLPLYSIYMARGKWYRYTDASKGYKWDPYKCIIMATKEQVKTSSDQHYGEGYRDADLVNIPTITGTDKLDSEFKLGYLDGRDDDDFENFASSKYMFAFDDDIVDIDDEGNESTAIKQLDGVDLTIQPDNCKVYNMSGQYVGNSLNGLGKGMYIVNGKKYVVK